jgi:cell division protein YceG involved in septum cleavage
MSLYIMEIVMEKTKMIAYAIVCMYLTACGTTATVTVAQHNEALAKIEAENKARTAQLEREIERRELITRLEHMKEISKAKGEINASCKFICF